MSNNTETFGLHLMVDGYEADEKLLHDKEALQRSLHTIPASMGMHTICEPVVVEVGPKNRKDPGGLSGFVLIAESHISFHTFPKRGFVTIDVYTCQNDLNTERLVKEFATAFGFSRQDVYIQKRGINYPSDNIYV
jgi:S-adenosylmethionine decarboxylase